MHPFLGGYGAQFNSAVRSNTGITNSGVVTSSATAYNNVTPVQMIASTARDACYLFVRFQNAFGTVTATGVQIVLEIMAGAASSEYTIIGPVALGGRSTATQFGVPIYIPAGTRISARVRSSRVSQVHNILVELGYGPNRDTSGLPQKWVAYGLTDDASSAARGTLVTAGSTNAWGSWTAITTSTTYAHDLWLPIIDKGTASTTNNLSYRSQWSLASTTDAATEVTNGTVIEGPIWATTTAEALTDTYASNSSTTIFGGIAPAQGIFYAPRAAGSAVSARVMCSGAPDANAVGCSILAAL